MELYLEPLTKCKVKLADDDSYLLATYLGSTDIAGCEFMLLHIDGDDSALIINAGFVMWIQPIPSGDLFPIDAHKKKFLRLADK